MTFSIVIPTKNRPNQLKALFNSLINQKRLPDQIIIIDQSEEDKVDKAAFLEFTDKLNKSNLIDLKFYFSISIK